MPLEKTDKKRESGRLLIFSERACCRRTLPQTSGSCRIFLSGEDTGLSQDITLTLTAGEGCWYMGERELNGKNPFYFYTDRKERLLLVLGQRTDTLYPGERILLKEDGSAQLIRRAETPQDYFATFDCFDILKGMRKPGKG